MRRPSTDLPLSDDPASRYLPWTVGLLVFLATLSLTVGMFLASAGDNWRRSLTGTLTIRYLKPTPIFKEIRMEGYSKKQDGRKIYAEGRFFLEDELLVEAHGTFIAMRSAGPDEG